MKRIFDVLFIRRFLVFILKNSFLLNVLYHEYYRILNRKNYFKVIKEREKLSIFQYVELSAPIPYYPIEFVRDSHFYGQSNAIRTCAGVHKLGFAIEHGLYYDDYIPIASFYRTTCKIIIFSTYRKKIIQTKLNKSVLPIGPYIHYADDYLTSGVFQELKKQLRKVMLVFLAHAGAGCKVTYEVNCLVNELEKIRDKFDTVVISLFWSEVAYWIGKRWCSAI